MVDYKYYDEKYANLLVNKCLINNGVKPLVIIYDGDELDTFAKICYMQAKKSGCNDVVLYNFRLKETNQYLANTNLEDIVLNDLIDRSILEEYAKKGSNLLFLEAYHENNCVDVDAEKRQKAGSLIENQLDIYYKNIYNHKCPWCLACYPTMDWARKVYPNMDIDKAYEQLYLNIMKVCFVDKKYPNIEWDNIRKKYYEISEKLNDLRIEKLHYSNELGTDLDIYLPENHLWIGADDRDYYGNSIIVNMPSFEIFTSPLYTETNGLVFSTKPLSYGNNINLFGLGFKNGAVNEILAQTDEDYELLSIILDKDFNSGYLGECALIDNSSPLFLTNTLYYETLYDENCSCHLALGNAFPDTIEGGLKMSEEELLKNGINVSSIHIDFMIGSDDLEIEAETNKGKKLIYSKGKYMI